MKDDKEAKEVNQTEGETDEEAPYPRIDLLVFITTWQQTQMFDILDRLDITRIFKSWTLSITFSQNVSVVDCVAIVILTA